MGHILKQDFFGRKEYVKTLQRLRKNRGSSVVVVYGRRRVGKTSLIQKAFENDKIFNFEGLENQETNKQIINFVTQLKFQAKKEVSVEHIKTWHEALYALINVAKKEPCVIVLDEFQWMANYRSELVSVLKMMWDQHLSKLNNVTLVLCGSIASFMVKKVIHSSAFYGRIETEIHLQPFQLHETAKMLESKGFDEILEAQILLGGIPLYLKLARNFPSIRMAVNELAFSSEGYFFNEFSKIFTSHFGKNSNYRMILDLLAKNPKGVLRKNISQQLKTTTGGTLTGVLYNLEQAGFIRTLKPFDKKMNSRHVKYVLSDPYIHFYLQFIKPHEKQIKTGIKNIGLNIFQGSKYQSWCGYGFENLCWEHAGIISQLLGFSGIDFVVGPYFKPSNSGQKGCQIDLLFDRADKVITLCEMKYRLTPIGKDVIAEVEKKAQLLENITNKTIQKVLVTKSEPTKELIASGYFYKIIMAKDLIKEL
ncbi:MAG: ATP-binding protein [bacterium]|nr:AAA family ATPase [bacterium]MBU1918576.1 AAA family ATPase [bacterium]